MSEITTDRLKAEVKDILKGADLTKVTAKSVHKEVEERLGVDLSDRRKELKAITMAAVNDQVSSDEVSEEETTRQTTATETKKKQKKRKADSDEESDEDWGKKKKQQKAAPAAGGGAKKQSAFTKSFRLSAELADVVGADVMPRHEVVKKLWAVIKERNLQDPKQKQFAICDDQLLKVFGIKRFRTFGMMKYLKDHFVEAV